MSNSNKQLGEGRFFREAMARLEQMANRNTGGTLLGKRMVHRSAKAYNRRAFKRGD